jgi:hypothetical protein
MVQTAIGSSMRAGTGLQLVNDVLPSLLGDLDPEGSTGGKLSIANQQTLGRIAGDYLNTFTFPLYVSVARDLYSLTDEEMRQIPETNGEVNTLDIMFTRAGRTLGPIREMLGMENEKDPRYSLMRSTPAKKVDPLRTATTGFNISENANEVEKEANRLQVRPYEIYRRFKFGPADVRIRELVASELPQKMSGFIRGEEYKRKSNENKRKFFKEKAREIVTGISSNILEELGNAIELFVERNPDVTEDMIKEEFGYTINDIMQYRYETEISKDNRAALESEIGKPTEDSNFSEYLLEGQNKSTQELASGGLVQSFDEGGVVVGKTRAGQPIYDSGVDDQTKQMVELGLDIAPVTGEIRSAQAAVEDFEEGNYGMAALGAIGALPLLGIPARSVAKVVKNVDNFTEFFTPITLKGRKGDKQAVPSEPVMRETAEATKDIDPKLARAKASDAPSILPAPGRFFDPDSKDFKPKLLKMAENSNVDVDLTFGNYLVPGREAVDVSNKTFNNLFVSPRTSFKRSNDQNAAVAKANIYDGPELSVDEMKANYVANTGKKANDARVIRTNLVQPEKFKIATESGERFLDHPIVAVQQMSGKHPGNPDHSAPHFYTLDAQFKGPVRMDRATAVDKKGKAPQPNLRPATVGGPEDIQLGNVVGEIRIGTNKHKLYDYVEVDGTKSAPEGFEEIPAFKKGGLMSRK